MGFASVWGIALVRFLFAVYVYDGFINKLNNCSGYEFVEEGGVVFLKIKKV